MHKLGHGDIELGLQKSNSPLMVSQKDPFPIDDGGHKAEVVALAHYEGGRSRVNSFVNPPESIPAVVSWKDLKVVAKTGKTVLQATGQINGGFWAIMGPSGSGKTMLLSALACRLDPNFKTEGQMVINGQSYTSSDLKRFAGYVMQDDLLNAHLTCKETLQFTAQLRLPNLTKEQKQERVMEVLSSMGLYQCRDVVVGHPMARLKGISGGQRKRLCVSQELLLDPILLFLDEPTSGLDSTTALDLVTKLQARSRTRCTVIASIHQPQSKIFHMFDALVLVQKGHVVFQGSLRRALVACEGLGLPIPPLTNPADHLLDILSPKSEDTDVDTAPPMQFLKPDEIDKLDMNLGNESSLEVSCRKVPWMEQFSILCRRNLQEFWRKRSITAVAVMQNLVMALLIGGVFLKIGTGQASATRRQPVMFFCCVNQGVSGAMAILNSFPSERALSLRERASGMYQVSAYFFSKTMVDLITQLITPICFSCIVYWMVGLQPRADKFFMFMCFMVLCNLAATSYALMISALCRTTDLSMAVLPMILEICRLLGGFFLSPANLPSYFVWLDALSYYKYAYVGISLNELHGLVLTCKDSEKTAKGTCKVPDGQYTIDLLGLDKFTITSCALILVALIFGTRLIAFIAVKHLKH